MRISTKRYRKVFGEEPAGFGMYVFEARGYRVAVLGEWERAKKMAIDEITNHVATNDIECIGEGDQIDE